MGITVGGKSYSNKGDTRASSYKQRLSKRGGSKTPLTPEGTTIGGRLDAARRSSGGSVESSSTDVYQEVASSPGGNIILDTTTSQTLSLIHI